MDEHTHHWIVYGQHGEARCDCGGERTFKDYAWPYELNPRYSWNAQGFSDGIRIPLPRTVDGDEED